MNEPEKSRERATFFKKMCAVMAGAGYIQKKGYNAFHKYSYAQEADILEHLRPLLVANGIFFSLRTGDIAKVGDITSIQLVATFGDIDTGYAHEIPFRGEGQDKGDKGLYKAYTGGLKYLLMKNFLLPTGDDPELDGEEERGHKKESNKLAKEEALASQAKLNREAEERQGRGEPPLAELKHANPQEVKEVFGNAPGWVSSRPSMPPCPVLPMKPIEALKKEMTELMAFQEISDSPFFSACVSTFKRIQGDWTTTEYLQAIKYLKDLADGKLTLEVAGSQGSFKRFEEPPPQEANPVPKFKVQICQEIWMACVEKAKGRDQTPKEILREASGFILDDGNEKFLALDDLVRATKETKWHKTTLRKLNIPEKEIPF